MWFFVRYDGNFDSVRWGLEQWRRFASLKNAVYVFIHPHSAQQLSGKINQCSYHCSAISTLCQSPPKATKTSESARESVGGRQRALSAHKIPVQTKVAIKTDAVPGNQPLQPRIQRHQGLFGGLSAGGRGNLAREPVATGGRQRAAFGGGGRPASSACRHWWWRQGPPPSVFRSAAV